MRRIASAVVVAAVVALSWGASLTLRAETTGSVGPTLLASLAHASGWLTAHGLPVGKIRGRASTAPAFGGGGAGPSTAATVTTDKAAYLPGAHVVTTGTGWQPNTVINLTFTEVSTTVPNGTLHSPVTVFASSDSSGNFSSAGDANADFATDINHDGTVTLRVTAVGRDAAGKRVSVNSASFTDGPMLTTDKPKYGLGEEIVISGSGFTAGVPVNVTVDLPDNTQAQLSPTSEADGTFTALYDPPSVPGRYKITATDGVFTAKVAVTEADIFGVDNEQCRNGGATSPNNCDDQQGGGQGWVTGNANATQAHLIEGDYLPYRLVIQDTGATFAAPKNVAVSFLWDTRKDGKNAIDFLSYDRTYAEQVDICDGAGVSVNGTAVPNCPIPKVNNTGATTAFNTAVDPFILQLGGVNVAGGNVKAYDMNQWIGPAPSGLHTPLLCGPAKVGAFDNLGLPLAANDNDTCDFWNQQPARGVLAHRAVIAGGDILDMRLMRQDPLSDDPAVSETTSSRVILIVSAKSNNVVVGIGGHIGSRIDWGFLGAPPVPQSAGGISGSPYHRSIEGVCLNAISSADCNDGGQQDRQLAAAAVTFPDIPVVTTVIHDASHNVITSIVSGATVHDSANVANTPNGTPTGSVTFTFYTTSSACTGTSVGAGTVALVGNTAHPSSSEGPLAAGSYSFKAHFTTGDSSKWTDADGPCEPLTVTGDANIQITPATANNEVGTNHTLTITVNATGGTTIAAAGGTATASITSGPGSFVGSPTCSYTGGAASANCTVVITSATPGTTVVSATSTIPLTGGGSFTRTTNGTLGNSVPAQKNWVDANISITPTTDTDPINDIHTLTAHVNVNPGTGFVNAPAGTSVTVSIFSGPGAITGSPCLTVGTTGSCTVTLTSAVAGTTIVSATTTVSVSGVSLTRTTGDGLHSDGPNATKNWVEPDMSIAIAASATNAVGAAHTFTITVTQVPNGGTAATTANITTSVAPAPGTSSTTCGATVAFAGNVATCTLTINSAVGGVFTANASATATISGAVVTRDTDPATAGIPAGPGGSGPAVKTYVDANISITPATDTDPINDIHTLTAHVNVNPGTGFVNAPAGTSVTVSIFSGPGAITGSPCLTVGTTGSCTVTLTSAVAGTTVIQATTTVTVGGVSLTRTTGDGLHNDGANATKNWVAPDMSIAIAASATNAVGVAHTFTITATQVPNGGTAATTANITTNVAPAPGTLGPTTCGAAVAFAGNVATCTLTINSAVGGVFTANASATATISGAVVTRDTDPATASIPAGPGGSGPAVKTYVDANISITPATDTDPINDIHTLTAHVNVNPGTGFVNAPAGTSITVTRVSGPGTITGSPCLTVGATGSCTVTLTSATVGQTIVSATTTVSVGGVSLTRTTGDGVHNDGPNAIKNWVASAVTTHVHDASHADITGGSVAIGTFVHDNATVDVGAGLTIPGGSTFTFHRFNNLTCTGASTDEAGVVIASVLQTGSAESSAFQLQAGSYGYVVDFVSGNPAAAASKAGTAADCEPFTITPGTTQVATQVHSPTHIDITGQGVDLGTAVHDSATVSALAPTPPPFPIVGTLTYHLFRTDVPNSTTCAGVELFTESALPLGTESLSRVLPGGTYGYKVNFVSGNANWQSSVGVCEPFQVRAIQLRGFVTEIHRGNNSPDDFSAPTIIPVGSDVTGTLPMSVHDQALASGVAGFTPTGLVTFTFFNNATCAPTGAASGSAGLASVLSPPFPPDSSVAHPSGVQTITEAGKYSFRAHFPGDGNYVAADSGCEPFYVTTITVVKVANGEPPDPFAFDITGGPSAPLTRTISTFSATLPHTGDTGHIVVLPSPADYGVTETITLGWALDQSGCQVDGGAATGTGSNPVNTVNRTWTFTLAQGTGVTCTYVNTKKEGGATRTQGFWATHTSYANFVWDNLVVDKNICSVPIVTNASLLTELSPAGQNQLMGGFWANIANKTTILNKARSDTDKARMQVLQQYLAALLNQAAFSTSDGGVIAAAKTVYCNPAATADQIKSVIGALGSYNTSGDTVPVDGSVFLINATAQESRQEANTPFWNVTVH